MWFHPAIKCSINQIFSSQSEVKDLWAPPQCETEWEGQTDLLELAVLPEQDTACCSTPFLLSPAASWRSQSTEGPQQDTWHQLTQLGGEGSPVHALLLCKAPPDQRQQGRMRNFNSAGFTWLGSPVPPGSYTGDFPCLHSENRRKCIVSSVIQVSCSKGLSDRLLGRF